MRSKKQHERLNSHKAQDGDVEKKIFLVLALFCFNAHANEATYYKPGEVAEFTNGELKGADLRGFISHVSFRSFNPLGYKRRAKRVMFGSIDLEQDEKGFFIKDVYCNLKVRSDVGPGRIPTNNIMNAEHTWPQSKGSGHEPFRGDLHHLFPTDSRANSTRSSNIFGEVVGKAVREEDCTASQVGSIINPETGKKMRVRGYQPPVEHRGNVARALFYSAISYGYRISNLEEYYLKKWHKEDPVDDAERERQDEIHEAQGNRNPFIDFPELAERFLDF